MEIVIPVLIGIALGVGATLGVIFGEFEVKTKEAWAHEEKQQERGERFLKVSRTR